MTTIAQDPVTSGQLKSLNRLVSDAVEKTIAGFGLDNPGAQRVIKHGDKLVAVVNKAVTSALKDLSVSDKYKNEEVTSIFCYLSGYSKPKGLTPQANDLRMLFSGLGSVNLDLQKQIEGGEVALPAGAEGWFAIPNWMKNPEIFGATYSQAVQVALDVIKKTRNGKVCNYRDGQITEKQLRQSKRTQEFFRKLAQDQGDPDILIVAAQFGIRHRGRSVRRAREVFMANEFGLGAFAVGTMLFTHPNRLYNFDDLWIDCAGDEFDVPDSGVRFADAPYFEVDDSEVEFGANCVVGPDVCYGSASGFFPQPASAA